MKPAAVACLIVVFVAALLVAGCGGGGSSAGSSSTTATPPSVNPGGRVKKAKAKAPNAPAGSEATSCPGAGGGVAQVRAVAIGCGEARATVKHWHANPACRIGKGESRSSCSLGVYRCQSISVERGAVVSCARSDGGDVSFVVKPSAN